MYYVPISIENEINYYYYYKLTEYIWFSEPPCETVSPLCRPQISDLHISTEYLTFEIKKKV